MMKTKKKMVISVLLVIVLLMQTACAKVGAPEDTIHALEAAINNLNGEKIHECFDVQLSDALDQMYDDILTLLPEDARTVIDKVCTIMPYARMFANDKLPTISIEVKETAVGNDTAKIGADIELSCMDKHLGASADVKMVFRNGKWLITSIENWRMK